MAADIINYDRMRYAVLAKLPGGEARTLITGPGFIGPDMDINARIKRFIDRCQGRAPINRCQPASIAMGQDIDTGAWSFSAPGKFLGPKAAAYGHTLSFDIAHLDPTPGSTGWVGLSGGTLVEHGLVHPFDGPDVALTWYNHVITLDASGEWYKIVDPDIPTTVPATGADILSVLQDLDALIISGEFADGLETDIAGLDNVILIPEPTTMGLLMLGLTGMGIFRRRRSRTDYCGQNLITKKSI